LYVSIAAGAMPADACPHNVTSFLAPFRDLDKPSSVLQTHFGSSESRGPTGSGSMFGGVQTDPKVTSVRSKAGSNARFSKPTPNPRARRGEEGTTTFLGDAFARSLLAAAPGFIPERAS